MGKKNIIFLILIIFATLFFTVGIFIADNTGSPPLKNKINPSPLNRQVTKKSIPTKKVNTSSCPSSVKDIDKNTYKIIQIGDQCWMKENLKVTKNASGAAITRYCYDDDTKICNSDGGLYNWNTAMNGSAGCNGTGASQPECINPVQGICPDGWHIPSHYEWTTLEKNIDSNPDAFVYDETTTGWFGTDEGKNLEGDDINGFNAILAGLHSETGYMTFNGRGTFTAFWSSTDALVKLVTGQKSLVAWTRALNPSKMKSKVGRDKPVKTLGYSIRCLKD